MSNKVTLEVLETKLDYIIERVDKINGELEETKIRSIKNSQVIKDHVNGHKTMYAVIAIIVAVIEVVFRIGGK